ncbi:SPW repeat protein [Sphingopyxis chilensis]
MHKQHWQDWINGLLGLWLVGSPWLLEHTMITEVPVGGVLGMWNLWTVGLGVVIVASIALYAFDSYTFNAEAEWTNLALGGWLLTSPWVLGFSASAALTWNAAIVGSLVVVFAGWALYDVRGPKQAAK